MRLNTFKIVWISSVLHLQEFLNQFQFQGICCLGRLFRHRLLWTDSALVVKKVKAMDSVIKMAPAIINPP